MINQINVNEAMLEGAKEVFETMVFMDITEAADQNQGIEGWALLGSISFKGTFEGCLAFCCNVDCAKAISANMLGIESSDVSEEETCDAMGEVANMLMGSVKARFQEQFGNVEVSIPSVVNGRNLRSNLGEGAVRISTIVNVHDEHVANLSLLYRERRQHK